MSEHCVTCRFFEANRLNADAPGRCRHNAPQAAEPTWPTTTPDDWCGQYERVVTQPSALEFLAEQAPEQVELGSPAYWLREVVERHTIDTSPKT